MSSHSSNTEEGEAWLLQVESRGEEFEEIFMDEDEGTLSEFTLLLLREGPWLVSPLILTPNNP